MKKVNKIVSYFIIVCLISLSTGCGAKEIKNNKIGNCVLYIECKTAIENKAKLKKGIESVLPKDGIIMNKEVDVEDGDTAFDILKRELKKENILLESSITPGLGTVYIEGINNLYEFDCGKQSGWMYSVNGEFLNLSCSEYTVKDGDKIEFRYTCNLGKDLGTNTEY